MSFVAGAVLKGIGSGATSIIFKELQFAFLGDANADIQKKLDVIINGFTSFKTELSDVITVVTDKNAYLRPVGKIQRWTRDMDEKIKFKAQNGETEAWRKFVSDLYGELYKDGGIKSYLEEVDTILTSNATSGTAGLLASYAKSLHPQLAGNDSRYNIDWYVKCIDEFLASAINIQLCGLAVELLACTKITDEKDKINEPYTLRRDMMARIDGQIKAAFNAMHPVVRQLKGDYFSKPDYSHWWFIKADNNEWMVRYPRNDQIVLYGQNCGPDGAWRLVPSEDGLTFYFLNGGNRVRLRVGWFAREMPPVTLKEFQDMTVTHAAYDFDDQTIADKVVKSYEFRSLKLAPCADHSDQFKFIKPGGDEKWANNTYHWLWTRKFRLSDEGMNQFDAPDQTPIGQLEGQLVKGFSSSFVYHVQDGVRRGIGWESSGDALFGPAESRKVRTLNQRHLDAMPEGPLISRDARLVKLPETGDAVWVWDDYTRRWIPNMELAYMYSFDMRNIVTLRPGRVAKEEAPIGCKMDALEGKRIQGSGEATIYLVLDKTLRAIGNPEVYAALFDTAGFEQRPLALVKVMPKGPVLGPGTILIVGSGVHLLDNGKRRWIQDPDTMAKYGFTWSNHVSMNLGGIPEGPKIAV